MTTYAIEPGGNDHTVDLYDGDALTDVRYGRWHERGRDGRYLVPAWLSGSDYSGSLVHASNYRSFTETYAAGDDVWWSHAPGGHGTYAVVIDRAGVPADVIDDVNQFLGALEDYPLADEDLHSQMECEAQDEAWERWARKDFVRELEKAHDIELDDVDQAKLDALFWETSDRIGEYWVNEQGSDVYIDVARIAAAVSESDARALVP